METWHNLFHTAALAALGVIANAWNNWKKKHAALRIENSALADYAFKIESQLKKCWPNDVPRRLLDRLLNSHPLSAPLPPDVEPPRSFAPVAPISADAPYTPPIPRVPVLATPTPRPAVCENRRDARAPLVAHPSSLIPDAPPVEEPISIRKSIFEIDTEEASPSPRLPVSASSSAAPAAPAPDPSSFIPHPSSPILSEAQRSEIAWFIKYDRSAVANAVGELVGKYFSTGDPAQLALAAAMIEFIVTQP